MPRRQRPGAGRSEPRVPNPDTSPRGRLRCLQPVLFESETRKNARILFSLRCPWLSAANRLDPYQPSSSRLSATLHCGQRRRARGPSPSARRPSRQCHRGQRPRLTWCRPSRRYPFPRRRRARRPRLQLEAGGPAGPSMRRRVASAASHRTQRIPTGIGTSAGPSSERPFLASPSPGAISSIEPLPPATPPRPHDRLLPP